MVRQVQVKTNDGCALVCDQFGEQGPPVILIHGWTGSRKYFQLNSAALAEQNTVYVYDQRFHGDSDHPEWGYHVHRLSADLRDLIIQLDLRNVTVIGSSMGCSVIWGYLELYGCDRLSKAVFIDQAPLQNTADDWAIGSTGCFDGASLKNLQQNLLSDPEAFHKGTGEFCLTQPVSDEIKRELLSESLKVDPRQLGKLMADHTQIDWRPMLPKIDIKCLNLIGELTNVFHIDGCKYVGQNIPDCRQVVFKGCNHWLYLENPTKFNKIVNSFISDHLTVEGDDVELC